MVAAAKPRFSRAHFGAAALLGALAATAAGCILFSNFDGLEGGTTGGGHGGNGGSSDAGDDRDGDAKVTCTSTTTKLCVAIPHVPDGFAQTVDGDGADFCDVPAQVINELKGNARNPCPAPDFAKDAGVTATLRLAWSDQGLHMFAEIHKHTDLVSNLTAVYHGDAVELFFANVPHATGVIGDDHVVHLILGPPATAGGVIGNMSTPAPKDSDVAVVLTADGYDVEAMIPWSLTTAAAPAQGTHVPFDFAVDTADPEADAHYSSALAYSLSGVNQPCKPDGGDKLEENDLLWCTPSLIP